MMLDDYRGSGRIGTVESGSTRGHGGVVIIVDGWVIYVTSLSLTLALVLDLREIYGR
jgi:hypothetical protein